MAIYTFSTKESNDLEAKKLKDYCEKNYLNFSAMVIKAVAKQNKEMQIEPIK